jgi:Transposase, Mutator family
VGVDTVEGEIRGRVRGMIEAIVEAELDSTLGAGRSQRVGAARTGCRHGARERQLTTCAYSNGDRLGPCLTQALTDIVAIPKNETDSESGKKAP